MININLQNERRELPTVNKRSALRIALTFSDLMPLSDVVSTMSIRPDRPLIVKATFDRYNKRITFSSARNCSYDLLRSKVEQSFSLQAFSFSIAYKDDDGEVTDITTESDLTEAIQYFQAGVDDLPVSSAQSILSGRSFGSRRITLRVDITVDYDGPSLSDTSSLASLDEYKNRSGSSLSLSFGSAVQTEPEDDSVTVSSRDTGMVAARSKSTTVSPPAGGKTVHDFQSLSGLDSESVMSAFDERCPADPSAVFERLKLSKSSDSIERNNQWLRDQTSRTMNGILAPESVSDGSSLLSEDFDSQSPFDGDLALQQDNGKFYYTYTSGSSSAASAAHDSLSIGEHENRSSSERRSPKHWIAAQQLSEKSHGKTDSSLYLSSSAVLSSSSNRPSMYSDSSSPLSTDADIPLEFLQFEHENPLPPLMCTDCSSCGLRLDSFRYVCSTCGEKTPRADPLMNGKGKARDTSPLDPLAYPPPSHRTTPTDKPLPPRPLPTLPAGSPRPYTRLGSGSGSVESGSSSPTATATLAGDGGYELCAECIETAGVLHALVPTPDEPASPENQQRTLSQLCRAPPKQKGHFRHAYLEKLWSASGWKDVEQDNTGECTICKTMLSSQRYKCASCMNFVLCRSCYSQVHEIHPSHAFLDVLDRPARPRSEPDLELTNTLNDDGLGDECESSLTIAILDRSLTIVSTTALTHPDVKCVHCLMDIVGARFHCAICESVDICSNCEAAGLPGNLDADDGGHNSSHIMIKIPIPLNSSKVQNASRRARQLWSGRDAPNVHRTFSTNNHSRADSLRDIDTVTVIGCDSNRSRRLSHNHGKTLLDHHITCKGCNQNIVGVRFQCGSCPATRTQSYSLCASCEERSYQLHDPMHIFFKLPRPIDRPIESQFRILPELYKQPAGLPANQINPQDPKAYLSTLSHTAALCDHCMERIRGEWFRCVYCTKDLCDVCENLDAHDPTHFFYVFKGPVDMQVFRIVAELDNPDGSPPVLTYPVYYS
ncbi:hypothetical protein EW145_g737 [Phellinidium pouzarii]|uniref:ZZ-type domain-containing protein n=1 Tax=Phellinidium pouzarii TaxID=167371 RepID=A0A4S4LJ24_9AGAM|nr:hypothetical protein EW145_g737 [Phellinidium pouzarii]